MADGLNIPRILASYMCQYRGSLIGKHFKTIVQVLPTIIFDLVLQDLLDAWLLLGQLTVLCWFPEIEDIDQYLVFFYQCFCSGADSCHRVNCSKLLTSFSQKLQSAHHQSSSPNQNFISSYVSPFLFIGLALLYYLQLKDTNPSILSSD